MRVLSLFSGIGAHDLGLERSGMRIVGQVEIDDYCQTILKKHWPNVKRWADITNVSTDDLRRLKPDIITGGFPCQDISAAGAKRGIIDGNKSSLWREMWRIVKDLRPRWVLIENVSRLRTDGADVVLSAMEALDYACWPLLVGSIHVGAPHERKRVLIVAHAKNTRLATRRNEKRTAPALSRSADHSIPSRELPRSPLVAAAGEQGLGSYRFPLGPGLGQHGDELPRQAESVLGSATHGAARRMALMALGNCNPPQLFEAVGRAIMHADQQLIGI